MARIKKIYIRALHNDLLWYSLCCGLYWVTFDPHSGERIIADRWYGWVQLILTVVGSFALQRRSVRVWRWCLIGFTAMFAETASFYWLHPRVFESGDRVTLAIVFTLLALSAFARFNGWLETGQLVRSDSLDGSADVPKT